VHQGAHGEATSVDPFVVPIRAAALRHVVSNLIPLRFLLLPLAIVVGLLMQEYTDPLKLAIWQLTAVFATVLVAATAARFRVVREPALTEALLAAASLAYGAVCRHLLRGERGFCRDQKCTCEVSQYLCNR